MMQALCVSFSFNLLTATEVEGVTVCFSLMKESWDLRVKLLTKLARAVVASTLHLHTAVAVGVRPTQCWLPVSTG